jgi:lysophospholipase L1-like esterase
MKRPLAADVAEFNAAIARLDVTMLNPPVLSNGQISERYTLDGLHLNGAGLLVLAETIRSNL